MYRQLPIFVREPEVELHQLEYDNHKVNNDIEMDNSKTIPIPNNALEIITQVRVDRRPTVGPPLLKLVQPCWPEVGPTGEMITLSVHWREQLARRRVPDMGRPRSKYACTRVENEIRALAGPDKVHYLISTLLVRY